MVSKKQIDIVKTHDQKYKSRRSKHMYIDRGIPKHLAFRMLSGKSHFVYLIFLTKRQVLRYEGTKTRNRKGDYYVANNGEIQFTYREAESLGITRAAFSKAIDQLIEFGFIDIAHTGQGMCKDPSLYSLSERWRLYNTPDFVQGVKRPKSRHGFGFKTGNKLGRNSS